MRTLDQIRERLRENLEEQDGGYRYRKCFVGTGDGKSFTAPHVEVRVELWPHKGRYRFRVKVDFQLPVGATPDDAAEYAGLASAAARTAQWAQNVVEGHEWAFEEVAP